MALRLGRTVKSLVQLVSANVVVRLLGIFMLAFYTRYLTQEQLAIFPVYEMLSAMATVGLSFGLHPTLIRTLPSLLEEDPAAARAVMVRAGLVLFAGALVFCAGIALLAPRLAVLLLEDPATEPYFRVLAIGFLLASLRTTIRYFLWSASRFDRMSVVGMVAALGRIVLAGGLLLAAGVPGLVAGLVLNELVALLVAARFSVDLLRGPRAGGAPARRLVRDSLPFYFESFLIYFRTQGDNWIIATMLGPTAMSIYFVAKRLPSLLLMLMESLDKVLTSELSRRRADADEIRRYIRRLYLVTGHLVAPSILFTMGLAPAFILVVAGREYAASVVPCMVLCVGELTRIMGIPLGRGLFVTHPPLTRVRLTVIETVFLVATLVALAPLLETTGVALSRVAAAAASLVASYVVLRRHMRLDLPWRPVLSSLGAALAGAGLLFGLQVWRGVVWAVPLYALAGVAVFLAGVAATCARSFVATLDSVAPFPLPFVSRILARTAGPGGAA